MDGVNSYYFIEDSDDSSFLESTSEVSENSSLNSSFFERESRSRDFHLGSLESLEELSGENEAGDFMFFSDMNTLCDDLYFITEMPEMCDVKFLVGKNKVAVYGVKAILATRSRILYNLILSHQKIAKENTKAEKKKTRLSDKLKKWTRIGKWKRKERSSDSRHLTIEIEEFDPEILHDLMTYVHSGRMNVTLNTVIGMMNAADRYGLDDLGSACFLFARRCLNMNSILPLLVSTDGYTDSKSTKLIVAEALSFIAENAQDVLQSPDFESLSQSAAILILTRSDLQCTEEEKWNAAFQWSRRHCHKQHIGVFRSTIRLFSPRIKFADIPASKLRREILPLAIVPDDVINNAILCQTNIHHVAGLENELLHRNEMESQIKDIYPAVSHSVRGYMNRNSSSSLSSQNSMSSVSSDSGIISGSDSSSML